IDPKIEIDDTDYHKILKEEIDTEFGAVAEIDNHSREFSMFSIKKEEIVCSNYTETNILPSCLEEALCASVNNEIQTKVRSLPKLFNKINNNGAANVISFTKMETRKETLQQRPAEVCNLNDGEKPYKCKICPADFSNESSLAVHKSVHTLTKSQRCNICSAAFYDKTSLRRHQRVHKLKKPYNCNICHISFANNLKLAVHQSVHAGENPYQCNFCPAAFPYKSHLASHKRQHLG
ncbi:unnamed protein product, partial [Lymnaea stagnalis]